MGYGSEGKAVTAYLLQHGIKPVIFDQKSWKDWDVATQRELESLATPFITGPDYLEELRGFNVAFRSPGLWRLSARLVEEESKGMTITSQTQWFFDHCPGKIIGVTGTKGKGTTSSLIYEILKSNFSKESNQQIFLTGNIGKGTPLSFLDVLTEDALVVFELSNFQLQGLSSSPHIGVVLMVTAEHLDHHASLIEYHEAKSAIVAFQTKDDFAIMNFDYEASKNIGQNGKGQKFYFSRRSSLNNGCFVKDGFVYCQGLLTVNNEFGDDTPILDCSKFQLRGKHNYENICAAVLASACSGATLRSVQQAVYNFKGLTHRLEFVADKDGISFYNDSFSTVPETTIAAIQAFTQPLILILGGSEKYSNYKQLGQAIAAANNIKAIVLIGITAPRIELALVEAGGSNAAIKTDARTMEEIFEQIKSVAENDDVVLLSPACASFGMFKNYEDRGLQFKTQVERWK